VGSATVQFGYSSKFSSFFGRGGAWTSKTCLGFSYCALVGIVGVAQSSMFSVFCMLICGKAMLPLPCVSCERGTVLSLFVCTTDVCVCKVTLLYGCASVGTKVGVPIFIL